MASSLSTKLRQEDLGKFRAGADIQLRQTTSQTSATVKPTANSSSTEFLPPSKRRKIENTSTEAAPDPAVVAQAAKLFTAPFVTLAPPTTRSTTTPHASKTIAHAVDADEIEVEEDTTSYALNNVQPQHSVKFLSVNAIAAAERDGTAASQLMPHFSLPALRVSAYSLALINEMWDVTKIDGVDPDSGEPQWTLVPKAAFNPAQPSTRFQPEKVNSAFDSLYSSSVKKNNPYSGLGREHSNTLSAKQNTEADQGKKKQRAEFTQEQDDLIVAEMEKVPAALRNTSAVLKKISALLPNHKPTAIAFRHIQALFTFCWSLISKFPLLVLQVFL
eukprot:TRINITY_DN3056_c0_g1_i2.p1 TRINITY_DN3056_c0_g1~~TRINITY_DN3056_c0_g1_i2.p1  ORF type:complete len:331 (-),score=62.02 TRINITY_DN3056_c0_g1_i2:351-1343(-)